MELGSFRSLKLAQDRVLSAARAATKFGASAAQRAAASRQVVERLRQLRTTMRRRV
jgi:hypothetical protein